MGVKIAFGIAFLTAAARIPVEERELGERFGAAWDAYRARTGALVPRLPV